MPRNKKLQIVASVVIRVFQLLALSSTLAAQSGPPKDDVALQHAHQILQSTPLVDGHNDLPWTIRTNSHSPRDVEAYDLSKRTPCDTDLARLKEGQVGAQFWSVWVPGELKGQGYAKLQLEQIDIARRMIARYPGNLTLALTASDIEAAFKKGLIASLLGMEGGHVIENSLGALRAYYTLGVRYMTLTHNVTLDWADAALDEPKHAGLTPFGQEVIREMNRLGMLVDLSHVTPEVMNDALKISAAPVIFSHSAARALVSHPRNVPDSILVRLRQNGGVIMVCFIPAFVTQEVADWEKPLSERLKRITSVEESKQIQEEYATTHPKPKALLSDVADHIEYIRKVAGVDHLGIGSDFFGGEEMPVGLEDTSKFPYLFAELVKRGWSDSDLRKLAGENILRVIREAESVAFHLQKTRPASIATIEELDGNKKK